MGVDANSVVVNRLPRVDWAILVEGVLRRNYGDGVSVAVEEAAGWALKTNIHNNSYNFVNCEKYCEQNADGGNGFESCSAGNCQFQLVIHVIYAIYSCLSN